MTEFEVIVVGGGHAGIEAALACARLHHKTLLVTLSRDNIGKMPCNPSIGGPAKGIVVREIDALGGEMPIVADRTALQFKMLNSAKGPGVRALRVQSDKLVYGRMMRRILEAQDDLTVKEAVVTGLKAVNGKVAGVFLEDESFIPSEIVIITAGTYMAGVNMISDEVTPGGPDGERTTGRLSACLREMGLRTFRLKTGTPPRVLTASIDFSVLRKEPGTDAFICFSDTTKEIRPFKEQLPCYITYTTPKTHELILANLNRSSMYSGVVKGVGPRYCPSIEDKLVRFHDKPRHLLFLEPESLALDTTYVQGFSTSLPRDIQEKMTRSLPGFKNAVIKKYAYAIEYDAIDPLQMRQSLASKVIDGLFTAGQVNGTSGYEEAAGQGIMAGINASLKLEGKRPLVLGRDEAYIGVMIDDLTTKGTKEPYRLLTSRAEFRLLMRHDNADQRLLAKGHEIGLVSQERYDAYLEKIEELNTLKNRFREISVTGKDNPRVAAYITSLGYRELDKPCTLDELLRRPKVKASVLLKEIGEAFSEETALQAEIETRYEGYIAKAKREANRLRAMDAVSLPEELDYDKIGNLSLEGRQKLKEIKPATIGQASRISGVNPADIAVLAGALKQRRGI